MDVNKATDKLNEQAGKLEQLASGTNMALAEMRIQFETLAQMQQDERIETQKMQISEKENLRKHYTRIIYSLIITLVVILAGIIGSAVYVFANYDILSFDVAQSVDVGGDGTSTIYDGIHVNDN